MDKGGARETPHNIYLYIEKKEKRTWTATFDRSHEKGQPRKAEALVGCCHGTHLGDGSSLPKMAVLLRDQPVEINLRGDPSIPGLALPFASASPM